RPSTGRYQTLVRAPGRAPSKSRSARTGCVNPYLKRVLGEAAAAARTDTFLGERHRRLVKRAGKLKALVAVARSILVIVWHPLANPTARFRDLGADFYVRCCRTPVPGRRPRPRAAIR